MTLSEYLKKNGRGAKTALREATGLRWATIHDLATGRQKARADTALKIQAATNGEVSAAELLGIEAPSAPTGEPGPVAA